MIDQRNNDLRKTNISLERNKLITTLFLEELNEPDSILGKSLEDSITQIANYSKNKVKNIVAKENDIGNMPINKLLQKFIVKDSQSIINITDISKSIFHMDETIIEKPRRIIHAENEGPQSKIMNIRKLFIAKKSIKIPSQKNKVIIKRPESTKLHHSKGHKDKIILGKKPFKHLLVRHSSVVGKFFDNKVKIILHKKRLSQDMPSSNKLLQDNESTLKSPRNFSSKKLLSIDIEALNKKLHEQQYGLSLKTAKTISKIKKSDSKRSSFHNQEKDPYLSNTKKIILSKPEHETIEKPLIKRIILPSKSIANLKNGRNYVPPEIENKSIKSLSNKRRSECQISHPI